MKKNVLMKVSVGALSLCLFGGTAFGMRADHTPSDTREAAETSETLQTEVVSGQVAMNNADSENTVQVMAAPKTAAAVPVSTQSADTTMVRVCQCGEHFVMEGNWKTDWRKHVMQAHRGSCHWGDNAFTEAEMRAAWPEDFEDSKDTVVEDTNETKVAHYWCSCGFHTTDKRELMRHTVAGNNAGDMIHSYNTTYKTVEETKEYEAKEQAEKEAAEKAAKEQAEREAAEKAAKEQAEREAAEKAAKEQAEREAAEKAAKEQAEREAAEKAAKEQAEREAAERAAREQAEREAAERAAKEQAEREAAERAAREQAEREAAEKAAKEQAEREAREQAEREAAEQAAREQAEREAAERAAREQAEREAAERAAEKAAREAAERAAAEAADYENAETGTIRK